MPEKYAPEHAQSIRRSQGGLARRVWQAGSIMGPTRPGKHKRADPIMVEVT